MKMPNVEQAQVDPEKLTGYLLSETHPVGRLKAKFFRRIGFNESNVWLLEHSLIEIAQTQEVVETLSSVHGVKYVVDGLIPAPSGKWVKLRTVWIIDQGQDRPRFVTAYPL